jgi:hypothetical protein
MISVSTFVRNSTLAALLLITTACLAAPLTVTTTADSIEAPPEGSLRKAIADAVDGDTIEFDPSVTGTITLAGRELLLTKNLAINGPGPAALAIGANQTSRVFRIQTGKVVSISGLTIRDGKAPNGVNGVAVNLSVSQPGGPGEGGGGVLNEGLLTCTDCWLINNSAGGGGFSSGETGGANGGSGGSGGAILNSGTLTLESCKLGTNKAGEGGFRGSDRGGGIGGRGGNGGAIHSSNGEVHLLDCSFDQNAAGKGGGAGYDPPIWL